MTGGIYISWNDVFDAATDTAELRARMHNKEELILTIDDESVFRRYMRDGATEVAEKLGKLGKLKPYEDEDDLTESYMVHRLTDKEYERGQKKAARLLKEAFENYVLYRWYRDLGAQNMALEFMQMYRDKCTTYRTNSTQKSFVKPKYRNYF